ncbi:MAG: CCA tRNA nucleotidyltransferase [Acidobacteria bacterium]|nr:CCA tRNA nucleotidyltransferase [Acidobacteriota bacterium]
MPDYLFLMESRCNPDQWQFVQRIQRAARSLNMNLYLAGGAVRDLIGGFPIEDLDFILEGKALKLLRALDPERPRVMWQNDARQEAEIEFANGLVASLCMARSEGYAKPGAAPVVGPATILDDLKRRDFSVNAIAISLNPNSLGLLLDPTNGVADIEKKEIRTLRNSGFLEQPIRLLRAVRLRARLSFALEAKTSVQFRNALQGKVWEKISAESLALELRQIAREGEIGEVLKDMQKEGLLAVLSPRLQKKGLEWPVFARAAKARETLDEAGLRVRSFPVLLHLLARRLSPAERSRLAKRLGLRKPELDEWRKLEEDTKLLAKELAGKGLDSPVKLYQRLAAISPEHIQLVLVESSDRKVHSHVKAYLQRYLPLRSTLPASELQELGIPPESARHQKILEMYFRALLEGKLRTRSDQTKFLKKLVQEVR